eukprot:gene15212-18591_t
MSKVEGEEVDVSNKSGDHLHAIIGHEPPEHHQNKPLACLELEYSIKHRKGDVYIATYPKTGTTLVQYICHILRVHGVTTSTATEDHSHAPPTLSLAYTPDFEDIHEVCPHTSSAWFLAQDLDAPQPGSL